MFKNIASQKAYFFAFDVTTNLPKTGDAANLTGYLAKDYGAVTVLGDTTATEMDSTNAKGYYVFDLTQAETNFDDGLFTAKSSTANISVIGVPARVFTNPANFTTMSVDASGRMTVVALANGTITAASIAAAALTAAKFDVGAIDASALATDAVAEIWAIAMSDLAAVPAFNASALAALNFLFMGLRNNRTQTATQNKIFKDDTTTVMATASTSDDGVTNIKGEYA